VKIHENEYFPCDMVVLTSNLPKGICYVETKNLDGETNLKHKQASKAVHAMCAGKDEIDILDAFRGATIECEKQNDSIYTFAGFMKVTESDNPISIDVD
jgi:magnesium-transporting ATPase (P-type)